MTIALLFNTGLDVELGVFLVAAIVFQLTSARIGRVPLLGFGGLP